MPTFTMQVFRGEPGRRRLPATTGSRSTRAWSCSTSSIASRPPRRRDLAVPVELQGRQVRLVQRGDQRQAAAHVHDPHGHSSRPARPITVAPIRTFPIIRDLVTDVSYNYEKAKQVPPLRLKPPDPDGKYRMMQEDVDRAQEFHKCIECFLCQDVCHVIRDHEELKTARSPGRASSSRSPASTCTRSTRVDRTEFVTDAGRHRTLQHHQVLHRGVPRAHPHHRQRHHPAEGADGRQLRPDRVAAAEVPRPEEVSSPDARENSRVPGQGAAAGVRRAGAERRRGRHAGQGPRDRPAAGRSSRREGAGARGRPRQGGRHQGGRRSGRRRSARPRQILGMRLKTPQTPPDGILVRNVWWKRPRPSTASSISR